jgi:hypothetical protein
MLRNKEGVREGEKKCGREGGKGGREKGGVGERALGRARKSESESERAQAR